MQRSFYCSLTGRPNKNKNQCSNNVIQYEGTKRKDKDKKVISYLSGYGGVSQTNAYWCISSIKEFHFSVLL